MNPGDTYHDAQGPLTITAADPRHVHYQQTERRAVFQGGRITHYRTLTHHYTAGRDRAELWVEKGFWKPTTNA